MELEAVDACGVVLVMWARVAGEDGGEGLPQAGGEVVMAACFLRDDDSQGGGVHVGSPAAGGIGMGVGKGQVGLDVQYGGAVHQVGTLHVYHRALGGVRFDAEDADRGETDIVGTERRARGPYTHAAVAAEAGRADGRRPLVRVGHAEVPQQPDVGETLQAAQGIHVAVLGGEDYARLQAVDQSALAWDAELTIEVVVDVGYGYHFSGI